MDRIFGFADINFVIVGFADICALRDIASSMNIAEGKYREVKRSNYHEVNIK